MSNPTTPFSWQMPTATDLVTDLPADFEVFGQAVATSMADLLGGTTGQILSKTSATDMDFTWITNDVGDITAVTAGTGISGGGTSGAVTITNSMATEITAKGDLIAGTGSATFDNLPVGTNGQTLVADSSTATGLKWATPASGGLTLISTTTFTAQASQSFNNVFTSTYTNYKIIITGLYLTTGASDFRMRMRVGGSDNTSAAYIYSGFQSTNAALSNYASQQTNFYFCDNNSLNAADENSIEISLFRPALAKFTTGNWVYNGTNNSNPDGFAGQISHAVATAYDGFTIYPGDSTLYGTVSIYGWSK